jgi:segregation and condensation protein B
MTDNNLTEDEMVAVDDVLGFDELEVDDFLERRTASDLAEMVGDLEVVADVETGEESVSHELTAAAAHLQVADEIEFDDVFADAMIAPEEIDLGQEQKLRDYDREQFRRAIEAIVMVSETPVATDTLADLLQSTPSAIDEICLEIAAEYETQERGFILTKTAGGYRYASHPAMADYVEQFVLEGQNARLSGAALETLAIVAYKQPVSRAQIAAIRGVNVDGVVRTLETRGWIVEVAKDTGPGQATLYGTTELFLEKLGLLSIGDLPPLGEFMPQADVLDVLERTLAGGERDARTLRSDAMTGDDINQLVQDDAAN